jgi:hypothetical protein
MGCLAPNPRRLRFVRVLCSAGILRVWLQLRSQFVRLTLLFFSGFMWVDSVTRVFIRLQGIFESVPSPKAGSVRISYINMHQASQFQDRMNRVMKPGTAWLKSHPRLQIWEEWSGIWDDSNIPQSVHEGNLQYLKNRQAKEGERMWQRV